MYGFVALLMFGSILIAGSVFRLARPHPTLDQNVAVKLSVVCRTRPCQTSLRRYSSSSTVGNTTHIQDQEHYAHMCTFSTALLLAIRMPDQSDSHGWWTGLYECCSIERQKKVALLGDARSMDSARQKVPAR